MSEQIHPDVAAWMASVAKALDAIPTCNPGYGEFNIPVAVVSFDGEPTRYAIVADEHGGYSLDFDYQLENRLANQEQQP